MKKIFYLGLSIFLLGALQISEGKEVNMHSYHFVDENEEHEGTWLNWPHEHSYGKKYVSEIEDIWVSMMKALTESENVHIVAYDLDLKERIVKRLQKENIKMDKVDFVVSKSDDVWSRDTGPIFAFDASNKLTIVDFAFDGWGKKHPIEMTTKFHKLSRKLKISALLRLMVSFWKAVRLK